MKTSELIGPALDWAVGTAMKLPATYWNEGRCARFSTDWAVGGPIIQREMIDIQPFTTPPRGVQWRACGAFIGPTPLIAAMRCFVALVLGDEVEVPDGL